MFIRIKVAFDIRTIEYKVDIVAPAPAHAAAARGWVGATKYVLCSKIKQLRGGM